MMLPMSGPRNALPGRYSTFKERNRPPMTENSRPHEWLVMIYLAGNNTLGEDCVAALTQMAEAQVDDRIAVFAQLNTGIHDRTTLRITKDTTTEAIHLELDKALRDRKANGGRDNDEDGTSHKDRIHAFVKQCLKVKAKRRMLILSGH